MPTSVAKITSKFNVEVTKSVKWGNSIDERAHGIYIVSTSPKLEYIELEEKPASFNENQVELWQAIASDIKLNGIHPTSVDLMNQLKGFWLPDETILYIGKAEKQSLSTRIRQYYSHKVGRKSPHKGGYWLKLLSILDDLYVHVIPTNDSVQIEERMLQYFMDHVSEQSKEKLIDNNLCLPFANLQLRARIVKNHGLKNHYQ